MARRPSVEVEKVITWSILNTYYRKRLLDYEKDETMSVGVELFDNDHKQLIDAINLALSMNSDNYDAISNVCIFSFLWSFADVSKALLSRYLTSYYTIRNSTSQTRKQCLPNITIHSKLHTKKNISKLSVFILTRFLSSLGFYFFAFLRRFLIFFENIRLTEQVKQYNKLHRKGKVSMQDLSKFLQSWLINHILIIIKANFFSLFDSFIHIMKEDMKYTEFFHTNGVF